MHKNDFEQIVDTKIYLFNGNVTIESGISLSHAMQLLEGYGFSTTATTNFICYHGKSYLNSSIQMAVHLYFDTTTEIIMSTILIVYPMAFSSVQQHLVKLYGQPSAHRVEDAYIWELPNCQIEHLVTNRFEMRKASIFISSNIQHCREWSI